MPIKTLTNESWRNLSMWWWSGKKRTWMKHPSPVPSSSHVKKKGHYSPRVHFQKNWSSVKLIILSSVNQIRWSSTLWKTYSEDYTIQLNKGSKIKWINPEIHSKIQTKVRSITKLLFPKHANSKWFPTMGWSIPLTFS